MKKIEIEAKIGKDGKPEKVVYELGDSLTELVKQFGEGVVFAQAKSAIIVGLQGYMRSQMGAKEPKKGNALQEAVTKWKPGQRAPGKPVAEKLREQFSKMDEQTRKELLAQLTGSSKTK